MQNEISVYVDIIFLENLIIDYVIIDICGKTTGCIVKPMKIFLGATLGAFYAAFISVYTEFISNTFLSVILKFIVSVLMCIISFGLTNRRRFILCNVLLYAVSFIFAGAFLALKFWGNTIAVENGGMIALWGSSSALYVVEMLLLGYVVVNVLVYCIKRRHSKDDIKEIVLEIGQLNIHVIALCDTGNELRDNVRDLPVIVCEFSLFEKFAGIEKVDEVKEIFSCDSDDKVFRLVKFFEDMGFSDRISVIPCRTVSNDCMMVGITADKVYPAENMSCDRRATVCFVNRVLSNLGEYNAVASPEIFL